MTLTLFHAPNTRAFTALWLLEELGIDYSLDSFDIKTGRHKQADYLAMNPLGKVPVVADGETPVSEIGAIAIYLADKYKDAGLAPDMSTPERAAYLKWCFFASAIIEPALGEKFFKWTDIPSSAVAWGSFDQMVDMAEQGLADGTYLLGDTFSACDVLVASILRFGVMFGAIPSEGNIATYLERCTNRDAFKSAMAIEDAKIKELGLDS